MNRRSIRAFPVFFAFATVSAGAPLALGADDAARGLTLAKKKDCTNAVPLLEQAELTKHRPVQAIALGDCYVATGEFVRASELYHALDGEKPVKTWKRDDAAAQKLAKKRAAAIDARIPTLVFDVAEPLEDLAVEVDGVPVRDPSAPRKLDPGKAHAVTIRARGRTAQTGDVTLTEREKKHFAVHLEAAPPPVDEKPTAEKPEEASKTRPPNDRPIWLGIRYRGVLLPQFLMNAVVDGGRTMPVPGGGVTLTIPSGDADTVLSLGYMSYAMPDTPFKGHGAPDTEWEIDSSDLHTLVAEIELLWSVGLTQDKALSLRFGGGVGMGWAFAGNLYRNQAYPPNGRPGNPYAYDKCAGPNSPLGTFRYCNLLDKDATFYGNHPDADWFHHGLRPTLYPWAVLPEIGLSWRVSRGATFDVQTGAALTGFLMDAGLRFAL